MPNAIKSDSLTNQIVSVFHLAERSRQYHNSVPLELSVRDITDVVSVHPVPLHREILDEIIFMLDDYKLQKVHKQIKAKYDKVKR